MEILSMSALKMLMFFQIRKLYPTQHLKSEEDSLDESEEEIGGAPSFRHQHLPGPPGDGTLWEHHKLPMELEALIALEDIEGWL